MFSFCVRHDLHYLPFNSGVQINMVGLIKTIFIIILQGEKIPIFASEL